MDPAALNSASHEQARRGGRRRRCPPLPPPAPQKRKACDFCFHRKICCDSNPEGCDKCQSRGQSCAYSWAKPQPKRGKRKDAQNQHDPPPNAFPGPSDALGFGSPPVPAPMPPDQHWDPASAAFQQNEGFFSDATPTTPSLDTPPAAEPQPMEGEWPAIQGGLPEDVFADPAAWNGQLNPPVAAAPPSPCECLNACLSPGQTLDMYLSSPLGPLLPLPPALRATMATAVDQYATLLDCVECMTKAFSQPGVADLLVSTLATIRLLYLYQSSASTPPADGLLSPGLGVPSADLDLAAVVDRLESISQTYDFLFKRDIQAGTDAGYVVLSRSSKLSSL